MVEAILCGATAVGKSSLALRLAMANGFEIVSADSRQVYRDMEIGTAQPTQEERSLVTHHLVSFLEPSESISPRDFIERLRDLLESRRDKRLLIVGGTGLYFKELLYPPVAVRGPTPDAIKEAARKKIAEQGLDSLYRDITIQDPVAAARIHPNDQYRILKVWENFLFTGIAYSAYATAMRLDPVFAGIPMIWLDEDREKLYHKIDLRIIKMAERGWVEEAFRIWEKNPAADWPAFSALGYREMADVARGRISLPAAIASSQRQSRKYAKRQLTFFRRQFPHAARWIFSDLENFLDALDWNWSRFMRIHENKSYPSP